MAGSKPVVDLTGGSDDEQRTTPRNRWPSVLGSSTTRIPTRGSSTKTIDLTKEDGGKDVAPKQSPPRLKIAGTLPKNESAPQTPEIHFLAQPYSSSVIHSMIDKADRQAQSAKKAITHISTTETELAPSSFSPLVASKPLPPLNQSRDEADSIPPLAQEEPGEMAITEERVHVNEAHIPSPEGQKDASLQDQLSDNDITPNDTLPERMIEKMEVPLDLKEFQELLRNSFHKLHQDHQHIVQSRLMHARESRNSETLPSRFTQQSSPFEGMSAFRSRTIANGKSTKGHRRIEQVVVRPGKSAIGKIDVPIISYTAEKVVIPPYTNYIATRRNVLIEDDKHRTFLPYHGDDAWVDTDYADLESKIGRNRSLYYKLNALEEQSRLYRPYAEKFIETIGCSMNDILYYLLDETSPPVPQELPTGLASVWLNRQSHITDDYYDDSDDSESMTPQKNPNAHSKQPKKQWQAAFKNIAQPPKGRAVAAAGLACTAFVNIAGFSLWHIAKKHALISDTFIEDATSNHSPHDTINVQDNPQENQEGTNPLGPFAELGCLTCFAHECPGHGEFEDDGYHKSIRVRINAEPLSLNDGTSSTRTGIIRPDTAAINDALGQDEDGSVSGQPLIPIRGFDHAFRDDEICSKSCFWLKSNRSMDLSEFSDQEMEDLHISLPAYYNDRRGACMLALFIDKPCVQIYMRMLEILPEKVPQPVKLRNQDRIISHRPPGKPHTGEWWYQSSRAWKHHERRPFRPCNHDGPCSSTTNCDCFENEVTCEKSCMCAATCPRRYQGCTCAARNRACWENERCECFRLHRECDPDLCRSCGAHEVLDPTNRYSEETLAKKCTNVYIQRGVPSRTLLGHSKLLASGNLSGWGLYAGQPLKKGDYIGEYVGEVVSSEEGERRGVIYDKRNMSYLFDLNSEQTLDSTRVGNKLRYINHQGEPYANCRAKVLLCGTVQRIGMFALQAVAVGDEILFDYGESFTQRFELIKLDENAQPKIEKGKHANRSKKKLVNVKATSKKTGKPPGRPRKNPLLEDEPLKPLKTQVPPTAQTLKRRPPEVAWKQAPRIGGPDEELSDTDEEGSTSAGSSVRAPDPARKSMPSVRVLVPDQESRDTDDDQPPRPSRKRKQTATFTGLDGVADEENEDAVAEEDESSDSYHESDEVEDEEEDEAGDVRRPPKDTTTGYITPQKRGWRTRKANMERKRKERAAFSRRTTRVSQDVPLKTTQKAHERDQIRVTKDKERGKKPLITLSVRKSQPEVVLPPLEEGKRKQMAKKTSGR